MKPTENTFLKKVKALHYKISPKQRITPQGGNKAMKLLTILFYKTCKNQRLSLGGGRTQRIQIKTGGNAHWHRTKGDADYYTQGTGEQVEAIRKQSDQDT